MKIKLLGIGFLIFILGCNKKDELKQNSKPLNSFSMNLNEQLWQPSIIGDDSCFVAYHCEWSEIDKIPFYTIKAYKDSQSKTDYTSENIFWLQIMDVNSIGVYNISDSYGDFNSFARFIKNESGNQKIYENSITNNTSVVKIEEMIRIEGSSLIGIRGTFSGVLFNKDNSNDSIVIDNCRFTFKKINWSNYYQCSE